MIDRTQPDTGASAGKSGRASADDRIWDAVCQSPSVFGRLVAVAALRQKETGAYWHPLVAELGSAPVDHALRRMHRDIFRGWLALRFQQQERDLSIWMTWLERAGQDSDLRLREVSRRLGVLAPTPCLDADRQLFLGDFRLIVSLIEQPESAGTSKAKDPPRVPSLFRRLFHRTP